MIVIQNSQPQDWLSQPQDSDNSSSGDEFNLERFRLANVINKQATNNVSSQNPTPQHTSGIEQLDQEESITILGVSFPLQYLKERNRNHVLIFQFILICLLCASVITVLIFIPGTNFNPYQSILSVTFSLLNIVYPFAFLNRSVVNGMKYTNKDMIYFTIVILNASALILSGFVLVTPFDVLPYFLSGIFTMSVFYLTMNQIVQLPHNVDVDDPNYQLKFFVKRILFGVINATGFIDVLSDIALGYEVVKKSEGILQVLGISMFVLCLMDFAIVNIRLIYPHKVTLQMHTWAIFLESLILTVTIIVTLSFDEDNKRDWDFVLLLVFSFVSTIINFLHHIFIIVQWCARRQEREKITYVDVFE
eukprot:TRINITY_DN34687_c2_g1_i2.p1 TRINITY_DN34687_c2_g1~~TRINITY_DN34687_c2_g1_i2.p1  ORF type:complete len:396 (-),score=-0.10 TRINITY_DN34687_c2_g1_i2:39-1124(-)